VPGQGTPYPLNLPSLLEEECLVLDTKLQYRDKRSKKIVFMSHCLLNCNSKFPGSADTEGVYLNLYQPIAEQGFGIEQMPCLEIMGWGGVDRPLVMYALDPEDPDADWIRDYPRLCREEAIKVVDQMQDYLQSDYHVLGVIYVSDSPTCGLTDTLTFPDVHYQMIAMQIPQDKLFDYEYKRDHVWPYLKSEGEGAFMYPLYQEVQKRGFSIPFLPFKPSNPRAKEIGRILDSLGIV
jgi:predicted secreted protein